MNQTTETIARLHQTYQKLSGLHLGPLAWHDEFLWSAFTRHGWTEQDLFIVVRHIQKEYAKYAVKMLRLRLLIEPQNFREKLAEAMAMQRNAIKPASNKAIALREAGRESTDKESLTVRKVDAVATELLKSGYDKLKQELENI